MRTLSVKVVWIKLLKKVKTSSDFQNGIKEISVGFGEQLGTQGDTAMIIGARISCCWLLLPHFSGGEQGAVLASAA